MSIVIVYTCNWILMFMSFSKMSSFSSVFYVSYHLIYLHALQLIIDTMPNPHVSNGSRRRHMLNTNSYARGKQLFKDLCHCQHTIKNLSSFRFCISSCSSQGIVFLNRNGNLATFFSYVCNAKNI